MMQNHDILQFFLRQDMVVFVVTGPLAVRDIVKVSAGDGSCGRLVKGGMVAIHHLVSGYRSPGGIQKIASGPKRCHTILDGDQASFIVAEAIDPFQRNRQPARNCKDIFCFNVNPKNSFYIVGHEHEFEII